MTTNKATDQDQQRQSALQVRDSRVFAFMDQLEKAEKFPTEIRAGIVSMLNEKIKYMMDWETAEMISGSELVPKDYIGKPQNTFLAIQTGRSLGLDPFQSVKHLYTVNGRTSIFGDMMLALAKGHKEYDDCIEEFGPLVDAGKDHGMLPEFAKCTIKRKDGKTDVVSVYTLVDARHNPNFNKFNKNFSTSKWTEPGTWMRNGKRMMQMRARSFSLRDAFPDKLSGIYDEYEIQEIQETKDITDQVSDLGKQNGSEGLKDILKEDGPAEAQNIEIKDEDGKNVQSNVESGDKEEPQEKPKNIDQIKADFTRWANEKIISKEEYRAFTDAGSSGQWGKAVKMHVKFSKKAGDKPLGNFAKKLSKIVDEKDYSESINSIIGDDSIAIINPDNAGEILRTKDEKIAKEVFELIESRKDMIDSAKKDK